MRFYVWIVFQIFGSEIGISDILRHGHLFKQHRNSLERFATGQLFKNQGDMVSIFLPGKCVELDNLTKTNNNINVVLFSLRALRETAGKLP
jgi:hypothetical protein